MQYSSREEPMGHGRSQRGSYDASEQRGSRRRHGGAEWISQQEEKDLFPISCGEGRSEGQGETTRREKPKKAVARVTGSGTAGGCFSAAGKLTC